jgi:uncharacterized protein (DUF2336 family)
MSRLAPATTGEPQAHSRAALAPPLPTQGERRASARLSSSDVERLLQQPGAESRIDAMRKLVHEMEAGGLSASERQLALDVLRAFASDIEIEVRAAVAWQIHNSPVLNGDMAQRLARDVAQVAIPILKHADALPDTLLLEIVAERDPRKQWAIASRRSVSEAVSAALVESGNVIAIMHLLRNRGARMLEATLQRAADRFGQFRAVADAVAARPEVTLAVIERIIALVSEDVRQQLIREHRLEPHLAARMAAGARDAATLRLFQPLLLSADDAAMVAEHLNAENRLTPEVLLRALCAGDLELFVAGAALRANIPAAAAAILAWDDGVLGLQCLLDAARIGEPLAGPFRVVQSVAMRCGYHEGACTREDFQQAALEALFDRFSGTNERGLDELLMQLADQPGVDVGGALMPMHL